ncbi:MAG: hypothetical protein QNL03_09445 [Gammaproteobacteria bacterium]|nr:hypothetical protein [Gammaproteobacteria bacterium]
MANEDLQLEIELLQAQLDEIKNKREAEPAESEPEIEEPPVESSPTGTSSVEPAAGDESIAEDLLVQFREMLDSIDKDIKDTKPSTLLIVFALGVLVGRL